MNAQQKYFFVFQNKSFKEESKLKYLWAPQKTVKGHNVSHWNMMKNVNKGDFVIHSYKQRIVAISRAMTDCFSATRPIEKGDRWSVEGLRVEAEYFLFQDPIKTKDHRDMFMRLQPDKNAPFDKDGSGNMGYLYSANKDLFDYVVLQTIKGMKDQEKKKLEEFLTDEKPGIKSDIEQQLDEKMNEEVEIVLEFIPEVRKYVAEPKSKPEPIIIQGKKAYPRDRFAASNALMRAEFKCEIDPNHLSFLRKSNKKNYTEPHHLIPMSAQESFGNSLDTEANIVSLCSNCHNQIHYGIGSDSLLKKLYSSRKDDLEKTGISITVEQLLQIYSE